MIARTCHSFRSWPSDGSTYRDVYSPCNNGAKFPPKIWRPFSPKQQLDLFMKISRRISLKSFPPIFKVGHLRHQGRPIGIDAPATTDIRTDCPADSPPVKTSHQLGLLKTRFDGVWTSGSKLSQSVRVAATRATSIKLAPDWPKFMNLGHNRRPRRVKSNPTDNRVAWAGVGSLQTRLNSTAGLSVLNYFTHGRQRIINNSLATMQTWPLHLNSHSQRNEPKWQCYVRHQLSLAG